MTSVLSDKLHSKRRQLRGLHLRQDVEQLIKVERQVMPSGIPEEGKHMRRQIANKNERRRMQSINAGFQALRDILPQRIDGERVSKAAILQQAVDHVMRLTKEHACLLLENDSLRRSLQDQATLRLMLQEHVTSTTELELKRKKCDTELSSDENGSLYCEDMYQEKLYRHLADLRVQLEQERRHRLAAEERLKTPSSISNSLSCCPNCLSTKMVAKSTDTDSELRMESSEKIITDQATVAQRNLETIMAAIQYLEGDSVQLEARHEAYDGGETTCDRGKLHRMSPLCLVSTARDTVYASQLVSLSEALLKSRDSCKYNTAFHGSTYRSDAIFTI